MHEHTPMAIGNCLFSLLLNFLTDFQFGVYLQNSVLDHPITHSRDDGGNMI